MDRRELGNIVTGIAGFSTWFYLSYLNPEHTLNIALASLMMLLGFGGRDTIIEIIKSWKQ